MRILNLVENTKGKEGCEFIHGLSFYIETEKHKILMDAGPTDAVIRNADTLGISLDEIDCVFLSHGHYDHSGGILPVYETTSGVPLYMQKTASADYYAYDGPDAPGDGYRYIGIDKRILDLSDVKLLHGDCVLEEELEVFTLQKKKYPVPFTNKRLLVRKNGSYEQDDFSHEQYLVIKEGNKRVLISGCAHNGILNILEGYREKYHAYPDVVISGFHLMKKTEYSQRQEEEIRDIARKLSAYPVRFVTCHCTGEEAYEIMKEIMKSRLSYIACGQEADMEMLLK